MAIDCCIKLHKINFPSASYYENTMWRLFSRLHNHMRFFEPRASPNVSWLPKPWEKICLELGTNPFVGRLQKSNFHLFIPRKSSGDAALANSVSLIPSHRAHLHTPPGQLPRAQTRDKIPNAFCGPIPRTQRGPLSQRPDGLVCLWHAQRWRGRESRGRGRIFKEENLWRRRTPYE